jgi:hypothetical protein
MVAVKMMLRSILLVFVLGLLVACGSTPVTFAQLPIPSDAKEVTTVDPMITSMQDSMKQAMGDRVSKFEVKTYTMPQDSDWDAIKSFYDEQLKTGSWKSQDELSLDSELVKMQGWTSGSFASEQALIVGYYPSLLSNEPYLMVMLASE